ncbi:MAG TPA: hypothetical protein VGK15_06245 [Candidatus Limnocylindria bacterium]|jgi:hypothetical protein
MRWLLKLYPPAWRERYESEMAALLEQQRAGQRSAIDLLLGAADAWVIGPRGPLGGLQVWLAVGAYAIASVLVAIAQRVTGGAGPWGTLFEILFWVLFIVFTTWLSQQPSARCTLGVKRSRR